MSIMKNYVFKCLTCKKATTAQRSLKCPVPRFCSKQCYQKASPKWLVHKEFKLKTNEEKADHLKKYFERNVIKTDGCWDWKKSKNDKYPRMDYARNEKRIGIHHYSWKVNFGEIPKGMFVCHKCDFTRCSRPSHLFLGTAKDNNKDCNDKGRRPKGENHAMAKLTIEQVKQIKELLKLGVTVIRIAKDFNVERSCIDRIKHNKTWQDVI